MSSAAPSPFAGRPVAPGSIIAAELAAIMAMIEDWQGVPPALQARLARVAELAGGLEPYIERCTTPPSAALAALIERTRREPWRDRFDTGETSLELEAEMLSGAAEGQFLKTLVRATGAKRILEIGLFTGCSALAMAEGLPADGRLVALEIDQFAADFARQNFGTAGEKIDIIIGPAQASLERLSETSEVFDLVFIDADKAGYGGYVDTILSRGLLRPAGLICVDNTLMQGEPYMRGEPGGNGRAIAAFNRKIAEDERVEQVILPLRDGLTLIQRI